MARHSAHRQEQKLRIIGGEWRGRKLRFASLPGLRPTPDRVRETLFNWLQAHTPGSRALDLFSGSGALGFEALSRGARELVFVDQAREVASTLKQELRELKADNAEVYQSAAESWLKSTPATPFDLVFLDPPFRKGLLEPVCQTLESDGWLTADAQIYIETEAELKAPVLPANWQPHREKRAGQVIYRLYRRSSD